MQDSGPFDARLASEIFLSSLQSEFFSNLLKGKAQVPLQNILDLALIVQVLNVLSHPN
jgi:hypothetical protein